MFEITALALAGDGFELVLVQRVRMSAQPSEMDVELRTCG